MKKIKKTHLYLFLLTASSLLFYFAFMRKPWDRIEVPKLHHRMLGTQEIEMFASRDLSTPRTVNVFDSSQLISLPYDFEGTPFLVGRKGDDGFEIFYTEERKLGVWNSQSGKSSTIFKSSGKSVFPLSYNKESILLQEEVSNEDQFLLVDINTGKYKYFPITARLGQFRLVLGCEFLYYIDDGVLMACDLDSGTNETIDIPRVEALTEGLACRMLAYSPETLYVLDGMTVLEKRNVPTLSPFDLEKVYEMKDYYVFLTKYDMYLLTKENGHIREVSVVSRYFGHQIIFNESTANSISVQLSSRKCSIYKFDE